MLDGSPSSSDLLMQSSNCDWSYGNHCSIGVTAHNKELEIVKSQLTVETQNTYNWCRDNSMVVSAEKTKAMLIISKSKESRSENIDRDFYINVNDTTIENTKHEKLLGVIIDNNLSWQH